MVGYACYCIVLQLDLSCITRWRLKDLSLPPCTASWDASPTGVFSASGYGARFPTDCWLSAWILALQSIWAAMLNAITLGIIFARISQPKQRARTIFISDSACIARRDGMLKFMFRVADIRKTQVSSVWSTMPTLHVNSLLDTRNFCCLTESLGFPTVSWH